MFRHHADTSDAERRPTCGKDMIKLTRLDKSDILINPDLIEHIELNSNTVVILTNGRSFVVKESSDEIQSRVIEFRRRIVGALIDRPYSKHQE